MKKVLFISYFWPPSGKASLHWPLDIIRNLPKDEIEPIILTVEEESFTQKDESLLSKVDPNWQIIKSKALEPFDLYRKFTGKEKNDKLVASDTISLKNKSLSHRISIWIRMNLFVPDARIGWYFTAVKAAKYFLTKNKIDAIVSVGPPHSSHLIGLKLSKKFSVPHIPVLIDPWVDIIYYKNFKRSKLTLMLDNYFEKSVLKNAKQVVFVTKSTQEDYINKYNFLKDKSAVLYWGYSEEDFSLPPNPLPKEGGNEEIILHAGNIFAYQNPKQFWKTIKNEIDKGRKLKLKFIGTVALEIKLSIADSGLSLYTDYKGFLPYKEMLQEMLNANYLLVCASEPRHVPGKLFEYLRAGKPIIAFGDNNTEVKQILEDANAGMMFSYDANVENFFETDFNMKKDYKDVLKFDRANIAKAFSEIIKTL